MGSKNPGIGDGVFGFASISDWGYKNLSGREVPVFGLSFMPYVSFLVLLTSLKPSI